jgi:hypothetical protein
MGKAWLYMMRGNSDARSMSEVQPFLFLEQEKLSWALSLNHAGVGDNASLTIRGGF